MDNKKVGCFIASLRKEKSMTQQSLADKLNVTSKAVSKWETGQGYPEITTIPTLAEILEVTTGELLNGEFSTKENSDKVATNTIINETVKYLDKAVIKKENIWILIVTTVFLFSTFVCVICNYLIQHVISWSLYEVGAIILLWTVIIPMIKMKKHKAMGMLLGLTITLIPYLFLVQYLTPVRGWVLPLALPITILSLIALGITVYMFNNTKANKFYSISITIFIFGVIVDSSVDKIVDNFLKRTSGNNISVFIIALTSVFLSFILFAIGYIKKVRSVKLGR